MIGKIKCWFGFHSYCVPVSAVKDNLLVIEGFKCIRCGKKEQK